MQEPLRLTNTLKSIAHTFTHHYVYIKIKPTLLLYYIIPQRRVTELYFIVKNKRNLVVHTFMTYKLFALSCIDFF